MFGTEPVLVTWCPLCGSGMAFKSTMSDKVLEFGVSGLLYNSDVLLYDRQSESLWSQISTKAIDGPYKGKKLKQVPMEHTSRDNWSHRNPETLVLSRNNGFNRNYDRQAYADYEKQDRLYFPVRDTDDRYSLKEWVLGITIGGQEKAYAFSELDKKSKQASLNEDGELRFTDRIGTKTITILFDPVNQSARAIDRDNEPIASNTAFWFAWYAFHPDTEVYEYKQ